MIVGFHPVYSDDRCGICLKSMANSDVVAHDGVNGDEHPWHRECIKGWLVSSGSSKCMYCYQLMEDPDSLVTWKDRAIAELIHIKKDAIEAAKESAIRTGIIGIALGGIVLGYAGLSLLGEESPLTAGGIVAIATAGVAGVVQRVASAAKDIIANRFAGIGAEVEVGVGVIAIAAIEIIGAMIGLPISTRHTELVISVLVLSAAAGTIRSVVMGILQRQELL